MLCVHDNLHISAFVTSDKLAVEAVESTRVKHCDVWTSYDLEAIKTHYCRSARTNNVQVYTAGTRNSRTDRAESTALQTRIPNIPMCHVT